MRATIKVESGCPCKRGISLDSGVRCSAIPRVGQGTGTSADLSDKAYRHEIALRAQFQSEPTRALSDGLTHFPGLTGKPCPYARLSRPRAQSKRGRAGITTRFVRVRTLQVLLLHVTTHFSDKSSGSPSKPLSPGGSSPMISAGGVPCSCI
jgi:hypothetical protein